jgi:hypothetical protein
MTFESDLECHLVPDQRFADRELRDAVVLGDHRAAEKDREKDESFHLYLRGPTERIVPNLQLMCVADLFTLLQVAGKSIRYLFQTG